MYKIVLLMVIASASAFVVVNSPCPEIKTVDNFDFDAVSTLFLTSFLGQ